MPQTFPWLSAVASAYEQYSFKGLVFEFKSTSANSLNSTNTALGTVIMATEYDSKKPPFSSKLQMENYEFATSCKPADSCLHPVECNPAESTLTCLYTRQPTTAGSDVRFTDLGQFYLATVGMQAAAVIGELWCTYEIELLKPRIDVVPAVNSMVQYQNLTATTGAPLSGGGLTLKTYAIGTISGISGLSVSSVVSGTDRITISNAGLIGSYINFDFSMWCPGGNVGVNATFSNPIGCNLVAGQNAADYFPTHYSSGATSLSNVTICAGMMVLVTSSTFSVDILTGGSISISGNGPFSMLKVTTVN